MTKFWWRNIATELDAIVCIRLYDRFDTENPVSYRIVTRLIRYLEACAVLTSRLFLLYVVKAIAKGNSPKRDYRRKICKFAYITWSFYTITEHLALPDFHLLVTFWHFSNHTTTDLSPSSVHPNSFKAVEFAKLQKEDEDWFNAVGELRERSKSLQQILVTLDTSSANYQEINRELCETQKRLFATMERMKERYRMSFISRFFLI